MFKMCIFSIYKLLLILTVEKEKMLVLASFTLTRCKLESFGNREPELRKCPRQTGLWANLWLILLTDGGCGQTQFTVGSGRRSWVLGESRLSKP